MMLFLKVLVAAVNLVVMVDGFCPCASQAPILETLCHATNGSGWLNPWDLASVDAPCSWTGVTCTSGGAIIGLNLSLRQLSGTIPKVITNLTSLQTLYFGFNRLQGTLHTEYQLLTQLTVFYFRENLLTGTLPPEYSTAWSPARFDNFDVSFNQIHGTLPTSYSKWTSVSIFTISGNLLTGTLPREYQSFQKLVEFRVTDNQLVGSIPSEYGNWSNTISSFYVSNNALNGTIPSSLAKWGATLWRFHVYSNQLIGTLPKEFGAAWTGIGEFVVYNNSLSGSLPPEYSTWSRKMNQFQVQLNRFTGSLPARYASWSVVSWIDVSSNLFDGTIPASWGNGGGDGGGGGGLVALTQLFLQNNQFSGTIPEHLLELPLLQTFSASFNLLTGSLPSQCSVALNSFSVQNNTGLVGLLPKQFSSIPQLRGVSICGTQITCPSSALTFLFCFPQTFVYRAGLDAVLSGVQYRTTCNHHSDPTTPAPPNSTTAKPSHKSLTSSPVATTTVAARSSVMYSAVASGGGGGASARGAIPSLQRSAAVLRLAALCSSSSNTLSENNSSDSSSSSVVDSSGNSNFADTGDNPLMLSISPSAMSPALSYAAGAAVGDAVLVIGIGVISHALCLIHRYLVSTRRRRTQNGHTETHALSIAQERIMSMLATLICMLPSSLLPGALFTTYGTLSMPAVGACVSLIISSHRTSASVASGALLLVVWVSLPLYCAWELIIRGRQGRRRSEGASSSYESSSSLSSVFLLESFPTARAAKMEPHSKGANTSTKSQLKQKQRRHRSSLHTLQTMLVGALHFLLHPTSQWRRRNGSLTSNSLQRRRRAEFLLEHLEPVFGAYVQRREWFFLVECVVSWLSGAIMGAAETLATDNYPSDASSAAACSALDWATYCAIILGVLQAAVTCWLRPFSVRMDLAIAILLQMIGVVVGGLVLGNQLFAAETVATIGALVEVIAIVLMKAYEGLFVLDGKKNEQRGASDATDCDGLQPLHVVLPMPIVDPIIIKSTNFIRRSHHLTATNMPSLSDRGAAEQHDATLSDRANAEQHDDTVMPVQLKQLVQLACSRSRSMHATTVATQHNKSP